MMKVRSVSKYNAVKHLIFIPISQKLKFHLQGHLPIFFAERPVFETRLYNIYFFNCNESTVPNTNTKEVCMLF